VAVKPARGGSALGVSIVEDAAALPQALVRCFAYGDMALIEKAVKGVEVAGAVIGTGDSATVVPAVGVVCDGPCLHDVRYHPGRVEYLARARLDADPAAAVEVAALAVHRSMGLAVLSRIDLVLDGDGKAQVLDIDIAPGMTETSLFPQA